MIFLRARRHRAQGAHLRLSCSLALGACALAPLLAPVAAQAQCTSSSNPSPPPTRTVTYANQSFGPPPQPTYLLGNTGNSGCGGSNGGTDGNGGPGSPGQPGGRITHTAQNVSILGPSVYLPLGSEPR